MYGIDGDLVRAVVKIESDFNPDAVSRRGAVGLMQLHPDTVKDMEVGDPFNPSANIAAGTRYLSRMLTRFNGNLDLALAAYNSGPATVERYDGVPPYPETQVYIKKVRYYFQHYKQGGS
ncbi:MAG: hypothetical protein B6I36_06360 [Desulfobacteraceae bacterium 4572_35.1]|nr:MAG: hypothetical protein B6I36_06360 [Desulfobacteraceae bacterium 4572_35.1]